MALSSLSELLYCQIFLNETIDVTSKYKLFIEVNYVCDYLSGYIVLWKMHFIFSVIVIPKLLTFLINALNIKGQGKSAYTASSYY